MLAGAANPLVWVGGGAISSGASEALLKVADHLQAPVISTAEGKGAISDRNYLSLGALRLRNDPITRSSGHDVILAVGTRMAFPNLLGGQQVVQIDIDAEELGRNYDKTFGILGDARRALEKLYCRNPIHPFGSADGPDVPRAGPWNLATTGMLPCWIPKSWPNSSAT